MAIDSRTITQNTSGLSVGIPAQGGRAGSIRRPAELYGSSPPIRLPSFASCESRLSSSNGYEEDSIVPVPLAIEIPTTKRKRSPRNNIMSPALARSLEGRSPSLEFDFEDFDVDDDQFPLSSSIFSQLSIDDFESNQELFTPTPSLPTASLFASNDSDACFARISKQGRKILKSARLPMETVLEIESLLYDRLLSKTPRQQVLVDEQHFFIVTLQNPFRRSLLHSICQYYRLSSQTVDKMAGVTVIKATVKTAPFPRERLSDYLLRTFGHSLP